ncbi:hypothetical protein C1H46_022419 [Malus baccata]|uniref:Uncharacterized protein n=1 Tax=Malus baccata TaxID=106549 RepID=A0A540LZU2_MALBA|nr:hypothetical protein C1H46_022419 [Malus baccata]
MSFVEILCRVPALAPARVCSTPPCSPLCLPLAAVLLGTCSELPTGDWPLSLGCWLPITYGCAYETSVKKMIGDCRGIERLTIPWIVGGEGSDASQMFLGFGLSFCFCCFLSV